MINSLTFIKDYDLLLSKETQKRFPHHTVVPTKHMREKKPFDLFILFPKGLRIEFKPDINIIVGENGSGKSSILTLLQSYVGKPIERFELSLSGYKDEEEYFKNYQKEYKGELQIDGVFNYRNTIFFDGEKDNPLLSLPHMINPLEKSFINLSAQLFFAHEESHGESMIPTLKYILKNAVNSTIFMDEPETALSLKNQFWLVNEMIRSSHEQNNQIIIATHALGIINNFEIIFDMETRKWVLKDDYINEINK